MKFHSSMKNWCRSSLLMAFVPSSRFASNASYPQNLNRSQLMDLREGCLLPIEGLDIEIEPESRVLIVGAGGADEMLRFIRNGHDCVGLEPDRAYARKTRNLLEEIGEDPAILLHSDGLDLSVEFESFDLVLFSGDYYSKIIGSKKRIRLLRLLHKALKPKGKIYFEFDMRDNQAVFHPVALIQVIRFLLHFNRPRIEKGVTVVRGVAQLKHCFVRHEITSELKQASLAIDELYTGTAGSVLCRRSCPLAKEPAGLDRRVLQAVTQL